MADNTPVTKADLEALVVVLTEVITRHIDTRMSEIEARLLQGSTAVPEVKPNLTLDQAIDEFEQEHPELLRLLAQ